MPTSQTPVIVHTRADLEAALEPLRAGRLALVMTMGALHDGHLALIRAAHSRAEHVVVTIFVNPTQFAPGEDFDAYPRTLDADVEAIKAVGADVVYAPSVDEVYPHGPAKVTIDPGPAARILEGKTRPTHFAGVCLVVAKVFNLVRPDVAMFGRKDAQQLAIIKRMVADLDMGIEIVGVDIVRDADGLALSSRNAYLSAAERERALSLSRALEKGKEAAHAGASASQIVEAAEEFLAGVDGVEVDYVSLVEPVNYMPVEGDYRGEATLALAARVGATRLIDNAIVEVGR